LSLDSSGMHTPDSNITPVDLDNKVALSLAIKQQAYSEGFNKVGIV